MGIHISSGASLSHWLRYGVAMVAGAALATAVQGALTPKAAANVPKPDGWQTMMSSWEKPHAGQASVAVAAQEVPGPTASSSPKAVFDQFIQTTRQEDPVEPVIALLKNDPAFRADLLGRYLSGLPGDENIKARFVLAESESPEVMRKAIEAARSDDPATRMRATALLVSMQDSQSDARAFLKETLERETDPRMLAQVVQSLHPQPFMSPQETAAIVGRIKELRDSPDVRLQQAALRAQVMWEGGPAIEKDVLQGMRSSDPDTVGFFIQTAMQGQLKSDAFKEALFSVVARGDLPVALRKQVVEVLGSTRLNESEWGRLLRVRAQL